MTSVEISCSSVGCGGDLPGRKRMGWMGAAERPETSAAATMTGVHPVMRTIDGAAAAAVAATEVRPS